MNPAWPTVLFVIALYSQQQHWMVGLLPIEPSPPASIQPVVSPPRDVRVNGQKMDVVVVGVGLTPTIEFSPPQIGTADAYAILLRSGAFEAEFVTKETSVTLPAGLIAPGGTYYVDVQALSGVDASAPFARYRRTGYGEAAARTQGFTP